MLWLSRYSLILVVLHFLEHNEYDSLANVTRMLLSRLVPYRTINTQMDKLSSGRVISGDNIMGYNFERLPGEGILIVTYHEDYSVRLHAAASVEEGTKLLDAEKTPTYLMIDASAVSIDLDDLISSATLATRQTRFLTHPIIREIILITRSKMLSLAAKGLDSVAFGHVKIKVFDTRDDALTYARQTK